MNIDRFLIFLVLCIHFLIGCDLIYSQNTSNTGFCIKDKNYLNLKMDSIISKDLYLEPNEEINIVFIFKIDSIGEVHSAHITRSENFKVESSYNICNVIERDFLLKFLFEKYKSRFIGFKYVYVYYVYSSIRN